MFLMVYAVASTFLALPSATTQRAGALLLRFTVSILMLFHGVAKLQHGLGPIESMVASAGLPTWVAFGVLIGEIVAPLFVLLGFFVRTAALVMAINMAVAIALVHRTQLLELSKTGGYALELQALFLFGALAIALIGGGRSKT